LYFLREARFGQHQIATHLVDDVQLVDRHRTLLHAGATARAGPQLFFGDVGVEEAIGDDLRRGCRAGVATFSMHEPRMHELHPVARLERRLFH